MQQDAKSYEKTEQVQKSGGSKYPKKSEKQQKRIQEIWKKCPDYSARILDFGIFLSRPIQTASPQIAFWCFVGFS